MNTKMNRFIAIQGPRQQAITTARRRRELSLLWAATTTCLLTLSSVIPVVRCETTITNPSFSSSSSSFLASLPILDELRYQESTNSVTRKGNLDVIETTTRENGGATNHSNSMGICHLATLLPLTTLIQQQQAEDGDGHEMIAREMRTPYQTLGSFQAVAAILLAISHLNNGDGSIVPEIASRHCPNIKFTTEFFDSQLDERKAIDHVIGLVQRKDPTTQPLPCAFVGSYRSAVTMPTSIITGLQGYPQFAALSTSSALDDSDQFPLSGRLNPSDDGTAVAAILYYQRLKVQHLAVLHTNDAYGNAYVSGLIQAAAKHTNNTMQIVSVDLPFKVATPTVLERRVAKLKDTGFHYFFGIIFDAIHYDPLMTEAVKQGIAGTGVHQWLFSDGVGVGRMISAHRHESPNSPLILASQGTGMITAMGGLPTTSSSSLFESHHHTGGARNNTPYDRLTHALQRMQTNPTDLEYLISKLPRYPEEPNYNASSEIIRDPNFLKTPQLLAPFLYDTVVALGLAACEAVASSSSAAEDGESDSMDPSSSSSSSLYLTGTDHFQQTVRSTFHGTSGSIVINPETGTREATSALFSVTNFVVQEDGTSIRAVVTDVFQDGDWTTLQPYTFNDGSTTASPDLPAYEPDDNHIDTAARVLILVLGTVSLVLSIIFCAWTYLHSGDRVVKSSQPIFLYIICVGTFLMGLSVLLLGIDDGILEPKACQVACILFPWLMSLGFALTASALFTKTHRINVIVNQRQFRRVAVSALDVMKPMFGLVGINAITLALWNILDKAEWVRETTEYDLFGRPSQSVGFCDYDGGLPYAIVLSVTNMGAILYALFEAYRARDISTEYAESEYIMKSMVTVLVVCFVGIPVVTMTQKNSTAFNCVVAGIVVACSMSFQLYIFVPKIKFNRQAKKDEKERPGLARRKSQVFRRGSARASVSSFRSVADATLSSEEFGIRFVNRRHIQIDLEAENKKLIKINDKLKKEIESLKGVNDGRPLVNRTPSQQSVTFDETSLVERTSGLSSSKKNDSCSSLGCSFAVSEHESIIEIDPMDHDDESHLDVAPF